MTLHPTNGELERYKELTPKSRAIFEQGTHYLPGGDTRSSMFWQPYPIIVERGEGCRLRDVDGVERIDFVANMTTLILGHAHPQVVEAIQEQATKGFSYAAPAEVEFRLARLLCQRVPSLELVRFTNSGTEATMNCIRAARAHTGRTKIAKVEGGYHGTHDVVSVSGRLVPEEAGDPRRPNSVPTSGGIPQSVVDEVVVIPFNDTEAAREILQEHEGEIAAVIVEPVLGGSGMVPADPEFLAMLRDVTRDSGTVLIFDEVISFRAAPGGAQEYYGITPDMTALGKVIGGGLPVGAFGGKREIMELYDPNQGPRIPHSGTFQGNPMTMTAGVTTLELLTPELYARLDDLTERLREGIRHVCAEFDVPVQVTGLGSLYGVHFIDRPVRTYRDTVSSDAALRQRVFWGLMNEGIFSNTRLVGCVSWPMEEKEIDQQLEALRKVLARR
ncbi:MAG: glutamate-1-semialdehyde 2,1-aminomutase [Dehalococcoidia bacterium]